VASTGRPRIALNVAEDAEFLRNPDLPDTRSEMALPLTVAGKIIGVLDIQSTEPNAFAEEDIDVLLTLANQAAIAIENARLFGETREALESAESAYRGFLRQEWSGFTRNLEVVGVHYDGKTAETIHSGSDSAGPSESASLVLPIVSHGEVVGELAVGSEERRQAWSEDEMSVLQAAADRVAIALENARLVQATEDRALRERALSEMGAQIGATVDLDTILQTAVQEVEKMVGDAEVIIQLNTSQGSEA
jgi:GAF domain-containing protein